MGNSASSSGRIHQDETVDFGYLTPQGVYTGSKDWNNTIVTQFIADRRLAPFYRPLEDYDDSWDDEQILAARREPPESDASHSETPPPPRSASDPRDTSRSAHSVNKRSTHLKEPSRCPEAAIYRGAVECPICFLYYPPNMNRSRCCDQSICTECFVQIKRNEPTTTHLVSEPAACPYCVQDNFGVVYTPYPWRAGIGSDGTTPPTIESNPTSSQKRRRKSFGPESPEVVTTDQIRPDWEAKLAAVRAAVARRANRRIIMRQVGDRLIPVGVTSGRVHALPTSEDGQEAADNGANRRSRRQRHQNSDINQLLGSMTLGGQELEELMVMEAMRLSLLEHEQQQKREADKRKNGEEGTADGATSQNESAAQSSTQSSTPTNLIASSQSTPNTASEISSNNDITSAGYPVGAVESNPQISVAGRRPITPSSEPPGQPIATASSSAPKASTSSTTDQPNPTVSGNGDGTSACMSTGGVAETPL